MFSKRVLLFLSIAFLMLSVLFLLLTAFEVSKRNRYITFPPVTEEVTHVHTNNFPTRIKIEALSLDLPVTLATLTDGKWSYSDTSVLFIEDSGSLGTNGNKIMYGHNYPKLLKNLKNLKVGDRLSLYSDNNVYEYSVASVSVVTSDQTHILSQTSDDRITLFTCTGFLDSKRLVVVAEKIQE